jgi:hypothetical protein
VPKYAHTLGQGMFFVTGELLRYVDPPINNKKKNTQEVDAWLEAYECTTYRYMKKKKTP